MPCAGAVSAIAQWATAETFNEDGQSTLKVTADVAIFLKNLIFFAGS